MIKPAFVEPNDKVRVLGHVFGTPLVVKGLTWLPLAQGVVWAIMSRIAHNRRPERSVKQSLGVGLLTMPVVVGLEWAHNFAHAAAARWVGKPMDVLRVTWGTPLVVYYDLADPSVSPRQHIIRALGGPVFNALAVPPAWLLRRITSPDSNLRDVADAALGMNIFLLTVGLLPLPGIDGGPVLKWSLVSRGVAPQAADRILQKVDGILSGLLGVGAVWCWRRGQRMVASLLGLLSGLALGFALGLLREAE